MRNIIARAIIVMMISLGLTAEQAKAQDTTKLQKERASFFMLLGRFGYFLASDTAFKDIYGNGAVYGGELRLGGKRISGWLEGNYRARTGKSSFTHEETKVKVLAVEGGVSYKIIPGKTSPYVAAGLGFYMFDEKNTFIGEAKKNNIGFCAAAGFSPMISKYMVLDCRIKYSTCEMKPTDFDVNVGGLTLGLGVGARF